MAGWFIHAYPFIKQDWDWSSFRYFGVLQRIAIAYGISALLTIRYDFKQLLSIISGILIFYWALLWLGETGAPYGLENNLVRKVDIFLFGEKHLYGGFGIPFDPEGLLSAIPSVGTVLIGYLMGGMLHTTKNYTDCAKRMAIFGFGLIAIGWIWGFIFPINKAIWTSSYVLFTGGIAALVLAGLTWLIDIKLWKKPFWIFEVFGTNSIFLFVLSGLWAKTILYIKRDLNGEMVSAYNYLYKTIFVPFAGDLNGSLLFALTHVLGFWLVLYWMYRKKIQIKL
jgi:predicted acyltransferase